MNAIQPPSEPFDPHATPDAPPGFITTDTPALPVVVPEAFPDWDVGQQRGYLARRHVNSAEARTLTYAYDRVRTASGGERGGDPWDLATSALGAAMAMTRNAATRLITTAVEMIERLPRTCALLISGWIGLVAAHTIAEETALVADEHMPDLDELIATRLAPTRRRTHPPQLGPLRKMLTSAVNRCDPVAADARAAEARRQPDVEMTPLRDDCAQITATLPAEEAIEIEARIDAMARTATRDDTRTIQQRRAAALVAMSRGWAVLPTPQGQHPTDPDAVAAARRIIIHAYDDGTPENRGISLTGYGPVTGHTADELVPLASPRVDALDDLADQHGPAAQRYTPSEALAGFCRGRDGTCAFPGCQTAAEKSDLDHIIPFDHDHPERGGQTTSDDLGTLCRPHHLLKTDGVWAYFRNADGGYTWIHGPNHPAPDPAVRITTDPTGPLAHLAAPRHPDSSRRQQEAAESGRTGSGTPDSVRRRPRIEDRRRARRRQQRNQARARRTGAAQPGAGSTPATDDEAPPF